MSSKDLASKKCTPCKGDEPAREGNLLQVRTILFGVIQDYCRELGIQPGRVMECVEQDPAWVLVHLPDGGQRRIEWESAWSIAVHTPQWNPTITLSPASIGSAPPTASRTPAAEPGPGPGRARGA